MNTLLNRIYEKRNKSNPCYMMSENQFVKLINKKPNEFFTVIPAMPTDMVFRLAHSYLKMDTYVEINLELYQSVRSFAIRKGLEIGKRKYFEKFIKLFVENGFINKIASQPNVPNLLGFEIEKKGGKDGLRHFESVQDYIEANTRVAALPFEKLDYLFRIYFALVTGILLVNLFHYYAKLLCQKILTLFLRSFFYVWLNKPLSLKCVQCAQNENDG